MIRTGQDHELAAFSSQIQAVWVDRNKRTTTISNNLFRKLEHFKNKSKSSYHFLHPIIGSRRSSSNIFREIWDADTDFIHNNNDSLIPADRKPNILEVHLA